MRILYTILLVVAVKFATSQSFVFITECNDDSCFVEVTEFMQLEDGMYVRVNSLGNYVLTDTPENQKPYVVQVVKYMDITGRVVTEEEATSGSGLYLKQCRMSDGKMAIFKDGH